MYPFKIGVIPESFRVERFASLEKAASIGAKGVQVYATHDDFCAENLTADQKKAFLTRLQDLGLVVSALCGDFGKGFTDPELNKIYVERSKRVLDLALEFGTDVVTTHIGRVPDDDASDTYKIMQEAEQYRNIAIAAPASPQNRVVAAKAADQLLNISGVDASVVISPDGKDGVFISARSIGEINVQILMEKLGGGGNRSAAAAQLEDISLEDAMEKVREAIDDYLS